MKNKGKDSKINDSTEIGKTIRLLVGRTSKVNNKKKIKMNKSTKKKRERLNEKMKKHPYRCGFLCVLLVLVIIPIFIWIPYLIGDNLIVLIHTSLEVGDVLGFYGAALTFLGTTYLGMVAFKQNEHHNKAQSDLDNANTLTPYLTISKVSMSKKDVAPAPFEKSHYVLPGNKAVVHIENIGQGLAIQLSYKHWFGKLHDPEDNQLNINLAINDSFSIPIRVNTDNVGEIKEKIITYQNIIGFRYEQTLRYKLVCCTEQIDRDEEVDEYFLHVYLLGEQRRIGMKSCSNYNNCEQ